MCVHSGRLSCLLCLPESSIVPCCRHRAPPQKNVEPPKVQATRRVVIVAFRTPAVTLLVFLVAVKCS